MCDRASKPEFAGKYRKGRRKAVSKNVNITKLRTIIQGERVLLSW